MASTSASDAEKKPQVAVDTATEDGEPSTHKYDTKPAEDVAQVASSTGTAPSEDQEVSYPSGLTRGLIIVALCLAIFLVALDQTIIAPALGAITAEFQSVADIGWYGSSYLLTTTALQPLYGKLYNGFPIKIVYLIAVLVFELGSLVSAAAPTSTAFIIGRAVAGLGTAGLFPGTIVILSHTLPLRQRPMAFGLIGSMWGFASVAGPLLGGAFTERVSWRWCFYINLPIGGLTMLAIFFFLRIKGEVKQGNTLVEKILKLDLLGTVSLIPAVICLLLALQWGGTKYAWSNSRIIGLFVAFGVLIIIFIGIQIWRDEQATLPPRFFKNRNIVLAMGFSAFFGAAFFPLIYYLSLYFQAIQGDSAVEAGIKLLPLLLASIFMSVGSGALVSVMGYYNPIVLPSSVLFAVGAGMITTFTLDSPIRVWLGYQILTGLGIGVGFQLSVLVVQAVLPPEDIPVGTACVQFFQSFGGAIFVAVAQTLFQNGFIEGVARDAPALDARIFLYAGANEVRGILAEMHMERYTTAVLGAYLSGLRRTYYISVSGAALTFCCAAGLSWINIKKKKDAGDDAKQHAEGAGSDIEAAQGTKQAS